MSLSHERWLAKSVQVAANLGIDPDDPDTWRQALVSVWTMLQRAPTPIQGLFGTIPEVRLHEAGEAAYASSGTAPGPLDIVGLKTDEDRLIHIGGWLRAAERQIADQDLGRQAGEPNEDWRYVVDDEEFFLVPMSRSAWRPPYEPGSQPRPYTRRALLRCRVLPAFIGGVPIHFTDYRRRGPDRPQLIFSASLFAGFDVVEEDEEDPSHFLVVSTLGPTAANVSNDIAAAARAGCALHVFPELTMMPANRQAVHDALAKAEWNDDGGTLDGPDIVVAGSWHERHCDRAWNEAVVYDATGAELLRFRKLFSFRDEKGRYEKIELGDTLEVLVTRRGLYGFGICLDLCQKATPILTDLDVDWMVVPSCGDWRTMAAHLSAADTLQIRYDTRSFVVQQVYPKRDDGGLGYVLGAPSRVGMPTEPELLVSRSFSSHSIVP